MARPRFSVVITTRDRAAILAKGLEALEKQTFPSSKFEVIVADDGSTDSTPEFLARYARDKRFEFSFDWFRTEPKGPAAARNAALGRARGELIVFINDDTYAHPEMLRHHDHFQDALGPAIIKGRIDWLEPADEFMKFLSPDGPLFKHARIRDPDNVSYDQFVTANVSVPRTALESERFDETLPYPAYEDSELGYRLVVKRGLRMLYRPEAIVYHDHPHDLGSYLRKIRRDGVSAVKLYDKYGASDSPNDRQFLRRYVPYMLLPGGRWLFFLATWLLGECGLARIAGKRWWWYFTICHHHARGALGFPEEA